MRTVLSLLIVALPVGALDRAAAARDERKWGIDATVYGYSVPDQTDFLMVVAPVDLRWFHVEGRYNYEGIDSGSTFLGFNAGTGDELRLDVTVMIGAVFGDVAGVAPALRLALSWWKLDLSSEDEVVVDLHDRNASFFYTWSELGLSPLAWLRLGTVVQRTRVLHTGLDIQRGLLAGVTLFKTVSLTFYELNLGWTTPTYIGAIGARY